MCGRYAHSRTPDQLLIDFGAQRGEYFHDVGPDWNMAPSKRAPIIVGRHVEGHLVRELDTATWGLVPPWAKDPSIGSRLINARIETVTQKPSFRAAFATRRAIVVADGYYEWEATSAGPKQPWFLSQATTLALAGLYEWWKKPDDSWLLSFTILTTAAEGEDGRIHDRAPLLVPAELRDDWLAPSPAADLLVELEPATPGRLAAWPVGRDVGNVRNNGPELIAAVE